MLIAVASAQAVDWPYYTSDLGGTKYSPARSALGYLYLPVSTASHDYYGGEHPGDNLFSESLVCLNVETGERVWHYQLVHHGLWDYDPPAPPVLLDVEVDGRPRQIVAVLTKQAFCFVFDRQSGEPIPSSAMCALTTRRTDGPTTTKPLWPSTTCSGSIIKRPWRRWGTRNCLLRGEAMQP
ncbi:MAG: PQQ-binding-like beta-propeller repeat protein [Gemmatimonadetes bacterium]|nr:PQQ-binding-like beta-propeller repeat protein [Gemmatimonadota bacterium]MYB70681.1 PQQ-binding-like beta-propeller repeat protein [Gemmatimonadota bacterium]